ncbi:MotE family protein [Oricola thermophila]|uniref:MotE family protein n=1 Tax=Oricola thermophila TaxID=2742145 RepID=A0A6N1VFE4_9HYPH|nr:MotE family protein [Oricola thermophila]QKV19641.1 MotE family protein [Oricola thermophila]
MSRFVPCSLPALAAGAVLAFAAPAHAQTATASILDVPPPDASMADIERFCINITDAARERRYALQKAELEALREEIEMKIAILEDKRAALKNWVELREEYASQASDDLVEVYSKMRPDAAAQRMEKLPGELSAALLSKLNPRMAGTILNEMSAERAALVTVIMSAAADKDQGAENQEAVQ